MTEKQARESMEATLKAINIRLGWIMFLVFWPAVWYACKIVREFQLEIAEILTR